MKQIEPALRVVRRGGICARPRRPLGVRHRRVWFKPRHVPCSKIPPDGDRNPAFGGATVMAVR
jgi:hypothetical protein